jgi:aspartate/methionine/tyrosine aminotransferase
MMLVDFSQLRVPSKSEFFEEGDTADWKACKYLIGAHHLATIPLSPFYVPHHAPSACILRICFAKTDEILAQAEAVIATLPLVQAEKTDE